MADGGMTSAVESTINIFDDLMSLKEDKTFSDVVVVVEDEEFHCHRFLLAATSDFFKSKLTNDTREARAGRIPLPGVTKGVFSTVLNSIYSNKIVLTEDNLFDVWSAADMLQVRSVLVQCMKLFDTKLSTQNCVDYLTKVRLFDQSKQQVLQFIADHFKDQKIKVKLDLLNIEELESLLAMETLGLYSEDDVITSVLNWFEKNQHSLPCGSGEEDPSDPQAGTSVSGAGSVSACGLADLLERTRYLLISEGCLQGVLAIHPLARSEPRFQALVQKISHYQAQSQLQQSWCPPAAVHRERSAMTNVLLLCQADSDGDLIALDLRNMAWKQVVVKNIRCVGANILCCKSDIYVHCKGKLSKQFPHYVKGQPVKLPGDIIRVANDSLYTYKTIFRKKNTDVATNKLSNFPAVFTHGNPQWQDLGSLHDGSIKGMTIADVIHIGLTGIIFCVGAENSYTVFTDNEITNQFSTYPDQLGSSSRLVTFRHDQEAFALQENGCLWRVQLAGHDLLEIKITQELALWDGEFSLDGAALYNNQLLIVGDFPDQSEVSSALDLSLAGVFQSIRRIQRCWDGEGIRPGISLAVMPEDRLDDYSGFSSTESESESD